MPLVSPAISLQVVANTSSANVMAGNFYEILQRPSVVEFGLVGSAVGILATVMIGPDVICQDQEVPGTNRFPLVPDDWILKAAGRAGSKIFITFRNRTAGNLNAWAVLNITPIG